MTPRVSRFVHVSTALVGATGLVYGWMRYFAESEDEFALVNHPWQPTWQHAHIVVAPLLVFACGLIWQSHVWARITSGFRMRRRTGLVLAALLVPMVASGYLLQVAESPGWQKAWVVLHAGGSTAWLAIYLWHQFSRREAQ